jgi:hypothetical protein
VQPRRLHGARRPPSSGRASLPAAAAVCGTAAPSPAAGAAAGVGGSTRPPPHTVRRGADALVLVVAALALAFLWELLLHLSEPAAPGAVVVWLVDEGGEQALEVCVADALRALEALGPYLGAVVVEAGPARSAILAALSRRHTGVLVTETGEGGWRPPGPLLTAGLGPGFRAGALAARAWAALSTSGAGSPKTE